MVKCHISVALQGVSSGMDGLLVIIYTRFPFVHLSPSPSEAPTQGGAARNVTSMTRTLRASITRGSPSPHVGANVVSQSL